MKSREWKSFRFQIMFCSLASMLLALMVACLFLFGVVLFVEHLEADAPAVQESGVGVSQGADTPEKAQSENKAVGNQALVENSVLNNGTSLYTQNSSQTSGGIGGPGSWAGSVKKYGVLFELSIIVALILGVVSFIGFFRLFTRKMLQYLERISSGIEEIAAGNLKKELPVEGENEFANIAERINAMTGEIQMLLENERTYEQEKDALITNVAHDLRTPLTSVIGYLDLVRKREDLPPEDQKKYISIAYDKAKRLEKLIETLFEFTKVGADKMQLHPVELDFKRFMEQMVDEFYPSFESAGLSCVFEMQVKRGTIMADPELLARGISNLFSNAVKYGRDGKRIKVKVTEQEEENAMLLSITNYGEIIGPEDLEHIFDKFFRGESSRSTQTGGTGLGLAIAKKVVLMHHGQISVSSDFHGTVFAVRLPLNWEQEEYYETKDREEKL